MFLLLSTVEPWYNFYNSEVLGTTNDFLYPSNSQLMEKYHDITKPHYSEQILPVPWHFVISKFYCIAGLQSNLYNVL